MTDKVITLLPHQSAFALSDEPIVLLDGGFGAAKTMALCAWAYQQCERYPRNLILIGRQHYTDLADSTIKTFFELHPSGKSSRCWNESTKTYRHPNGSEILFRHLDDETGLKNLNLGGVGIDQAEEITPDRFDLLLGRLRRPDSSRQMRLTSNPNGHDWLWQLFYPESPDHRADYQVILVKTTDNPHLPEDYVKRLLSDYSPEFVEQYVYGSREVMLGYRFFNPAALKQQVRSQPLSTGYFVDGFPKPDWREQEGGSIRIHERYDERDRYCIGADVATGDGSSWCAAHVRNATQNRTAAVLDADIRPDELAVQLWLLSRYYGNAVIAPERNSMGFSVVSALQQLTGNLFSEKITEYGLGTQTNHLGWWTDAQSRFELFAQLQREIARHAIELKDAALIEQCQAVTMQKGKPKAEVGFRDDLVIACGISGMVRTVRGELGQHRQLGQEEPPSFRETSPALQGARAYGYGRGVVPVAGR